MAWYWWPFAAVWRILTTAFKLTGRVLMTVFGLVFIILGGLLTLTGVLAVCGVPFLIIGFLFVLRSLL
jgi:hypothetical protein